MAKLAFTKLSLGKNQEIKTFKYNNESIEVKQYLPVEDKLALIENVIDKAYDTQTEFCNTVKVNVFLLIETIQKYTNITFTEKQLEKPEKLIDLIVGNTEFFTAFLGALPEGEYEKLQNIAIDMIDKLYTYKNSVLGILDTVSQDYSQVNYDVNAIQEKITNPENLQLLKQIAPMIGLK